MPPQRCVSMRRPSRAQADAWRSARSIDEVLRDEDVAASVEAGAVLFAVPLLADAGRTVRINISLDKALVDQIDTRRLPQEGLTRSAFLAQAAREKIGG